MKRRKRDPEGDGQDPIQAELVDRCKAGDEAAWRELVEITHRDVYTLCLRILRDPDDAAEATQDAFLKAWRGLKGFRGDAQFTTWLYRVATNAAISKHRSLKRKKEHEAGTDDERLGRIPAWGSTEATAGARLDLESLERALGELPRHYRDAVVLRDVYGMSIEEIAKQMKCSNTAAKVRVHRGRKQLRAAVEDTEQQERET